MKPANHKQMKPANPKGSDIDSIYTILVSDKPNNNHMNMKHFLIIISSICLLLTITSCKPDPKNLLRIQENQMYGYIDTLGNVIIKPQYKYAGQFSEDGYALIISNALIKDNKLNLTYGYINKKNDLVVDTVNHLSISLRDLSYLWRKNDIEDFIDRYNSKSLGFLDTHFRELTLSQGLYPFQEETTNLIGYKNLNGDIVIPARFKYVSPFSNNVAIVSQGFQNGSSSTSDKLNIFSLINTDGVFIKENAWAYASPYFINGLTWCYELYMTTDEDGNISAAMVWTQIDTKGRTTIGPIDGVPGTYIYNGWPDNNGLYTYQFPSIYGISSKYTFINRDGKFATDWNGDNELEYFGAGAEVFDDVTPFSEGFAGVKLLSDFDSQWTYMTPDFKIATIERYDSVTPFHDDIAVVQQANRPVKHLGLWGAIDKQFRVIIPYKFSQLTPFHKGFAYANIWSVKYDREGYINKKGEFIWETHRRKD